MSLATRRHTADLSEKSSRPHSSGSVGKPNQSASSSIWKYRRPCHRSHRSSRSSTSISISSNSTWEEECAILTIRSELDIGNKTEDDVPHLKIGHRRRHHRLKQFAIQIGVQRLRDGVTAYTFFIPWLQKRKSNKLPKVWTNRLKYRIMQIQVTKDIEGHIKGKAEVHQPPSDQRLFDVSPCLTWLQVPLAHTPSKLKNPHEVFENVHNEFKRLHNNSNAEYMLVEKTLEKLVGSNRFYVGSIGEVMKCQGEDPKEPVIIELDGHGRCLTVRSN